MCMSVFVMLECFSLVMIECRKYLHIKGLIFTVDVIHTSKSEGIYINLDHIFVIDIVINVQNRARREL